MSPFALVWPSQGLRWFTRGWLALAVLLLAGCSSSFSARVTTFQHWPADAQGSSYAFDPAPAQQDLPQRTYADVLRTALNDVGLHEAAAGTTPRFTVQFAFETQTRPEWVEEPYWPAPYGAYGAFGPFGYAPYAPFPGFYGYSRWGWGGPFFGPAFPVIPPTQPVQVLVAQSTLTLSIRAAQPGAAQGVEVYQVRVVHQGEPAALPVAVPYLVRAAFEGFPQASGTVREVSLPLAGGARRVVVSGEPVQVNPLQVSPVPVR